MWKYEDTSNSSTAHLQSQLNSSIDTFTHDFVFSQGAGVDWVRRGVSWAVAVQNLEALKILLGCGYWRAAGLVTAGGVVRWTIKGAILNVVGLEEGG